MANVPPECQYLVNGRFCKVVEYEQGRVRRELCTKVTKNICCFLCPDQQSCEIGCDSPEPIESGSKDAPSSGMIGKCPRCEQWLSAKDIRTIGFKGLFISHYCYVCPKCKTIIGFGTTSRG